MKITNKTKLAKDNIVKDSIIKDYLKYVEYLENLKYVKESMTIYEYLPKLVTINNLKANNSGIILDILCPPGIIISIPGIKSYPENYNIEDIYPFEIKLANSNGEELDQNIEIKIFKNKILRKDVEIFNTSYKYISTVNYSNSQNKFKTYKELYRFDNGIELKDEDHLKIYVVNPDIDINIVKFNLGVDIWTPID